MQAQEVAIIIGSVAALVIGIAGVFMKWLNTISKADREERICTSKVNAEALKSLGEALLANTESNREIAKETKKAASEAKERNGHLAELQIKSQEMIDRNLAEYREMSKQHVTMQEVDKQHIKEVV